MTFLREPLVSGTMSLFLVTAGHFGFLCFQSLLPFDCYPHPLKTHLTTWRKKG